MEMPEGYLMESTLNRDSERAHQLLSFLESTNDGVLADAIGMLDGMKGQLFLLDSNEARQKIKRIQDRNRRGDRSSQFATAYLISNVRSIVRGFVEVGVALSVPVPERPYVAYLTKVLETKKYLVGRENGSFGYHYHYCDAKGRRSDTVLCFDTWTTAPWPLFWEKHGAGKFPARARAWKDEKRQRIHRACFPDTSRFGAENFRHPAAKAEAVWPLSAVRTARKPFDPRALPRAKKKFKAKKHHRH
ncbi:MAG: hypothetical protein ACXIVF_08350 [Rhizobiaceae bacterium]